jgi:muramoyltetrapeptide carboxypeptidase
MRVVLESIDNRIEQGGFYAISNDRMQQPRSVELIMPSGYPPDMERVKKAVDRLAMAGHRVLDGERLQRKFQRFGGTDEERLSDLNLLVDANRELADIVMVVRGGYGLTRLLDRIDYSGIAARLQAANTVLVGHSDFTVLQLALMAKTGLVTFSGPMLNADFGAEPLSQFTWDHFWQTITAPEYEISWQNEEARDLAVSGTLWGGNLTMLCSLLGTPYFPAVSGGILFVEDVNEPPFRVERLLYQLHLSGILSRQAALVLGDFSACKTTDYDNGFGLPAVIEQIRRIGGIPVVSGLPYGHCPDKLTLPVGAMAKLRSADGRVDLKFSHYPCLCN